MVYGIWIRTRQSIRALCCHGCRYHRHDVVETLCSSRANGGWHRANFNDVHCGVTESWVDTHIPNYGNPGVGYLIFWRRILLVLIGFTAAAIVTFFPKPPSGSRHYRRLLYENLLGVKDRYALFASTWRDPPSDLIEFAEKEGIASEEPLTSIAGPIKLTKFEFSTS